MKALLNPPPRLSPRRRGRLVCKILPNFKKILVYNLVDFKKRLQNAYFLAKIGADTAENEQHFSEILPIGRRVAAG